MKLLKKILNLLYVSNSEIKSFRYVVHPEAVIIACYFNPQGNVYRLNAFNKFYESIKHLNYRIVECVIGDAVPQLPQTDSITRIYTKDLLWHKEGLLNNIIKSLPLEYKYVFWLDTDVTFTNKNWLVDSVEELKTKKILQPFEYCVHLDRDQVEPHFDITHEYEYASDPKQRHPKLWRSFAANYVTTNFSDDTNYDKHGHVGFAWGARREVLDAVPLYDRALIGGADHIIAHAAAGQLRHSCLLKSFTDDIDAVNEWSKRFYGVTQGKIGYVKGDLYHTWHGDIEKRQYLKRIQDFTPTSKEITELDENGLYVTKNNENKYVKDYFKHREDVTIEVDTSYKDLYPHIHSKNPPIHSKIITKAKEKGYSVTNIDYSDYERKRQELEYLHPNSSDSFIESLLIGYFTDSTIMGGAIGGNILGGAIGDMLNNDTPQDTNTDQGFDGGFGGGGLSGGGAGGDWSDAPQETVVDSTASENFS